MNLAFGAILGHEITHGFDELRRPLNIDGSQYKLWSKETAEMYKKRSKCMIDQYNNYILSQIKHRVYFQISKITIHYFIVVFFH